MPAQKRPLPPETLADGDGGESSLQKNSRQAKLRGLPPRFHPALLLLDDDADDDEDSEGIDLKDLPEYILVDLAEVRKDVECGICLGIIKKTSAVMGCMHRFCKECIEKSMRKGDNKGCPACRLHCASRRDLRVDNNYDELIRVLFQDIEKYEAEELRLLEEEKTCNEQIQASIAQIYERQSDVLIKRVRKGKDKAEDASTPGLTRSNGRGSKRRGRNKKNIILVPSDDEGENEHEDMNVQDEERELLSINGQEMENKKGKTKRGRKARARSLAAINLDSGESENGIRGTEQLKWGGGGARSHTRHGIASGSKGTTRLDRLVNHLENIQVNDNKLEVHLILMSLDDRIAQQLYIDSRLSVKSLCEYVANAMSLDAIKVEMLLVLGESKDDLVTLKGHYTLGELQASCTSVNGDLVLAYRRKDAAGR